jgi:hypothetical protein
MVLIDEAGRLSAKWRLAVRVASDPTLPALAYRLFPILLESVDRQTGLCDYATRTFAAKFSAPASRIRATFAALARAGYLTIEHRGGKVTSKGTTNAYRPAYELVARAEIAEGTELSPRVVSLRGRNRPPETVAEGTKTICSEGTELSPTPVKTLPLRERGAIAPAADKGNGKHPPRETGKTSHPSTEEAAKVADEFWTRYPASERKEDRKGVTRKIVKILTTGDATAADLLSGLAGYAKSPSALKGGKGEFVKAPMVFLNRETWKTFLPQAGNGAARPAGPLAIRNAADAARIYDVGAG